MQTNAIACLHVNEVPLRYLLIAIDEVTHGPRALEKLFPFNEV